MTCGPQKEPFGDRDQPGSQPASSNGRPATADDLALLSGQILDSLEAHIAIVDETGRILAVNQAWRDFAAENSPVRVAAFEGTNYLGVCEHASGDDQETAIRFASGIRAVLEGKARTFSMEYPCHSPTERRWFLGRVTRFAGDGTPKAVITHENITERKLAEEEVVRRSEQLMRFTKVSTERELRMIELKQKINELSIRLGERPPHALGFIDKTGTAEAPASIGKGGLP